MTPLVRNGVAWAALAIVGLGGWGIVGLAMMPVAAQSARMTAAESVDAELVVRRDRVKADLAKLPSASLNADPRLDIAADAATAMQKFQERVRNALGAAGGIPVLSQTATESVGQSLTALKILMRARLGEAGLMTLLKTLESGAPSILVSELQVQQQPGDMSGTLDVTANLTVIHADPH